MGGSSSKEAPPSDHATSPASAQPDYSKESPREKLPPELQKIIDKEDEDESLWDSIYEGHGAESTDTNLRYAAYATRVRTILLSAHRYVAYTSDIGESFRPIAHPYLVKGAYGVSWAYLLGDVSHEGYKAYLRQQSILNPTLTPGVPAERATDASTEGGEHVRGKVPAIEDWRSVMVQRTVFQSVASMGLPAFTIHSIVRYSGRAMKDVKNARLRTYGPIGLGLAAVPFLPFVFDKPVEEAVEWTFHQAFRRIGGPEAVEPSPTTGREGMISKERKAQQKTKEKEL